MPDQRLQNILYLVVLKWCNLKKLATKIFGSLFFKVGNLLDFCSAAVLINKILRDRVEHTELLYHFA